MEEKVSIVKKNGKSVLETVKKAVDLLGGMSEFVKPGQKVMLKPNCTGPLSSDDGAVTSNEVIESVITLVREAGAAQVDIVEGSGAFHLGTKRIYETLGVAALAKRLDVSLYDVNETEFIAVKNKEFRMMDEIELSKMIWKYDVIINIPVMKTHPLTEITVAYKNMNGLLSPRDKRRFHDYNMRKAIVDLTTALPPYLTIVDGLTAMEGLGPLEGTPVKLDIIMAGSCPAAVDATAARVMGFEAEKLEYLKAAEEAGHGSVREEDIQVLGETIRDVAYPFKTAEPGKREYEGVSVYELEMPEKCYGCRAVMTIALTRIREAGHLPRFKGMQIMMNGDDPGELPPLKDGEHLFCLGNCTKGYYEKHKDNENVHFIMGCAPAGLTTEEAFRDCYGISRPDRHVRGHVD